MKYLIPLLVALLLNGCSCSKDEPVYGATELWQIAHEFDPTIELVPIPNNEVARRVVCENYSRFSEGCVVGSGKRIKVRKVELLVIKFEKPIQARRVAKGINQWYARNWVFDDVTNEPVLEDFVKKALGAKPGSEFKEEE